MQDSDLVVPVDLAPRESRERELFDWLEATVREARELVRLEQKPGTAESREAGRLAAALPLALGPDGMPPAEVLERLRTVLQATPSSSSWRFVNQLFGGREPAAVAAEMLALVPNISMYTFKAAGAQILVEREVLRRMADKVGLPGAEACFTPGGSIANLVALLLARNAADPGSRDGGAGFRSLTVYTSAEAHYSVPKNAGIVGIGRHRVRAVATRDDGTLDPESLAAALAADRAAGFVPALVNATAGTTVRGAFDPIRPLAALAREHGAWLHVDGAFGGSVALSSSHRHLLDGSDLADSFTWDPHKMMGVPLQCSALIVARPGALAASLDETADYLFQADDEALNPGHRSIQCGRRNDALKLWAAWLRLGDRGWDQRLARQLGLARRAAERIAADPALELVEAPPSINVCFLVRGVPSDAVCDRLDRDGRLKIGHGVVRGKRAIRLVCVNPDLDDADLGAILGEVKSAARELKNS